MKGKSERSLSIDEVTRCALMQAFSRNPHLIWQWAECDGRLKVLASIPRDVHWFVLGPDAQVMYRAFAQAERERLATSGHAHGLRCEHTAAQHRDALDAVIKRLPSVH